MSKWEQIEKTTSIISKGLNEVWDRKLKKDASVMVADSWSNFLLDSANDLRDAQNHLDVGIDSKSNSLACLMNLPDNHIDASETGKPFANFFMSKLANKSAAIINSLKNPYAKEILEQKLNGYRANMAQNVASFEASMVMDKRHNMAIENIEKLAKATYANPTLFSQNKETALIAINSLDIDPKHKAKLLKKASTDIAEASAESFVMNNPRSILDQNIEHPWKQDLDFRKIAKIDGEANQAINAENKKKLTEFNQLAKIHLESILARGKGIDGLDDKLESLPEIVAQEFIAKEQLHIKSYDILDQIKYAPLSEGLKIASSLQVNPNSENYVEESLVKEKVISQIQKQKQRAEKDPALFVEELFLSEVDIDLPLAEKINKRLSLQTQKGIPSYKQKLLTQEEREHFQSALDSRDANIIQSELNNMLKIESNHESLGHKIVEEILQENKLSALNHFYIEANLHSRGNLKNDLARAMASGQALGEMSKNDKDAIQDRIKEKTKDWQDSILAGNSENVPEVLTMQTALLELARFYQFEKHVSIKEGCDLALRNLFETSYIKPYANWNHGNLYIPRTIIEDGRVKELETVNINYALQKLRGDLINHKIEYDAIASFGKEYYPDEALNSRDVESSLRGGTWRLSQDKKSVYYVYHDHEAERPLMKSNNEVQTWSLLDLNEVIAPRKPLSSLHPYGAI